MTQADLFRFMHAHRLAVIATVSADNLPQAALVGFAVSPDLELIFDTLRSTRKFQNVARHGFLACVIGWEGEQTLQYEGEAEELSGDNETRMKEVYFRAYPDGRDRESWAGLTYVKVRPKWIRYSDYNQSPPLILEWTFQLGDEE